MDKQIDLTTDWLADASLTLDQRRVWDRTRAELIAARSLVKDLETRLKTIERQPAEEAFSHSILTRPEFNREVARMLAFDERYGGLSSVLYFDIENLNAITEQHGRAVANAAIRTACDALMKSVRNSDIIGRLASDELGVLLARCDNAAAWKKGEAIAAKLHAALSEVHGCTLKPNISYGAYTFRDSDDVAVGIQNAANSVTRSVI